jgi:predicted AAA+ superfamily ATPase
METIAETLDSLAVVQSRLTAMVAAELERRWPAAPIADRAVLLHGPRGVGKTSFFLRQAALDGGVYLSLDHPALSLRPVHEWVEELFRRGVMAVYLDEVHQAGVWSQSLKALYDAWPNRRIWASGSNSLLLSQGIADLSRRFPGYAMPYLSFREFLVLKGYPDYGVQSPLGPDMAWTKRPLTELNVLGLFESYLSHGFRPVFTEGVDSYGQKILQVVQKTIEADLPYIVSPLGTNHYRLMNAILGYLAQTAIPVVHVNSLCREWNVGKEKLYTLLQGMEQAGLIRIMRRFADHAAMSVGAKIFLADPTLYRVLGGREGNAREAFVAAALQCAGRTVYAASDETQADFRLDDGMALEVGGGRKARKGADLVIRDGADWPAPGIIPLWCLGFGW